jgi:hypothetical protein
VPIDRILERRRKSHQNFRWFADHADIVLVYDNTSLPTFAAGKIFGTWMAPALHALADELREAVIAAMGTSPAA